MSLKNNLFYIKIYKFIYIQIYKYQIDIKIKTKTNINCLINLFSVKILPFFILTNINHYYQFQQFQYQN